MPGSSSGASRILVPLNFTRHRNSQARRLRQVGDGLDVIVAPAGKEPHPPAARFLAEHKRPARLDQGGDGAVHRGQCPQLS